MEQRNRFVMLAVGITVAVLGSTGQAGAQTKEARGTVSGVAEQSVTVKVGAQELTFFVDRETRLEVRSADKEFQQAKAPTARPRVNDYFAPGNIVLVRYEDVSGRHHALDIQRASTTGAGGGSISEPARIAAGKVKAITASQLTLEANGGASVFAITGDTGVLKKGATKATKAAGGSTPITTFVRPGDSVSISYSDRAGVATASEVRVRTP
jgi:hypothetical protein